ncbi:MAG: hypothetical protein RI947_830 [Candidatus Parcubacteria bacterium]|jgi:broad specificity phosphatase PhoE
MATPSSPAAAPLKWPSHLAFIRHGQSVYNGQKALKTADATYQRFLSLYEQGNHTSEVQALARAVTERWKLDVGDFDTPLTSEGIQQATHTGRTLRESMELPNVIVVSPYKRAHDTLEHLKAGWPALGKVEMYEEERIREQEHGLALLYNDWRVFFTLHPQQRRLYELEGQYYYRYPQGENVPDVRERNRSWLNTVVREFAGLRVLVVTHHLTILATRANLERMSADQFMKMDKAEKPANCGVTLYTAQAGTGRRGQGKLKLEYYNRVYY